ncbi:VCBS domain-containing protein [Microvirga subterranea]|uniref:FecR family protein n=1 Tax=Microvirga subterranea TaxID=186651 RepID=A0A370HKW0_9HYPH|nr:VCBS domain-containing protein [Microvirga subterranea]RDI58805.1 FecR family protein [Microvirga subterranea]
MYQSGDGATVFDIWVDAEQASGENVDADGMIVFPDADLLFTADFKRSGADLLLIGQDVTAVITGYFKDDRRPNIRTPEGASLTGETIDALAGPDPPGQYAQSTDTTAARVPIGRVEKVSGTATVLRNGVPVELHLGDPVAKGDVVQTAADSSLTIKLNDGTVFGLSSSARMVLNEMVYSADSQSNSAFFTLVQGVIGFVAGRVAKTGDLKVDTPVATMAIRGTAVHTEIAALSGVTKISLLTEPDGSVGSFVLLDKNNPSRVLTTISDARSATILTPRAASDLSITQVTKTADELRGESDLVRDLFQIFAPQQRRGSSDFEPGPIVPANLLHDAPSVEHALFSITPYIPELATPRDASLAPLISPPAPIRGNAVEDGPLERLDSPAVTGPNGAVSAWLVDVPAVLPPGVRYVEASRTFTLDPSHPAYQHLGAGDKQTVTVNYSLVVAGSRVPASVSWTVSGANDAPVVRGDVTGAATEDRSVSTLSALAKASDVDSGATLTIVDLPSSLPPGVTYDAATKTFRLNPAAYQSLAAGAQTVVVVDYTVSDGIATAPASASWTVTGANDSPVITSAAPSGTVTEAAELVAGATTVMHSQSGAITFTDVDTPDTHTATFVPRDAGYPGTFSLDTSAIDSGGTVGWTFSVADSVLDSLAAGQVLVQRYDVTVSDAHGGSAVETVTVTITGANDAPEAANDIIVGVDEARPTVLALLSNDRDVDSDALRIVQWTAPAEGFLFQTSSGDLAFDPGDAFSALGAGETATVSFTYTVSDGKGGADTANATVQVRGEGTYSSPLQADAADAVLGFNQQTVTLTMEAPSATTTATAELGLTIDLGPVVQPQSNILYLVDVSGSTARAFAGTPVGDLNGDGSANTVLDAEIAGLITLTERIRSLGFSPEDVTVTVIPFNGSADPTDDTGTPAPGVNAATFSLGEAGEQSIANYLRGLDASGQTNFADALRVANEKLQGLDQGGERNFLYFLSDGNGEGPIRGELATLNDIYGAKITAVGIGADASLSQLNTIDNTGGASRLTSPDQIDTTVLGRPLGSGQVVDVAVFVNGTEVPEIGPEDLVSTPTGLALDASVSGLDRIVGEDNVVTATVTFASNEVLTTQLTIAGALPRSTDFLL